MFVSIFILSLHKGLTASSLCNCQGLDGRDTDAEKTNVSIVPPYTPWRKTSLFQIVTDSYSIMTQESMLISLCIFCTGGCSFPSHPFFLLFSFFSFLLAAAHISLATYLFIFVVVLLYTM